MADFPWTSGQAALWQRTTAQSEPGLIGYVDIDCLCTTRPVVVESVASILDLSLIEEELNHLEIVYRNCQPYTGDRIVLVDCRRIWCEFYHVATTQAEEVAAVRVRFSYSFGRIDVYIDGVLRQSFDSCPQARGMADDS
jgi:hypothetical protein